MLQEHSLCTDDNWRLVPCGGDDGRQMQFVAGTRNRNRMMLPSHRREEADENSTPLARLPMQLLARMSDQATKTFTRNYAEGFVILVLSIIVAFALIIVKRR